MMQRGCGLMMVMVVMREEEQQAHHAMAGLTRAHCFKTLAYASTLKQLIALPGVVARCLLLSLTPHTPTQATMKRPPLGSGNFMPRVPKAQNIRKPPTQSSALADDQTLVTSTPARSARLKQTKYQYTERITHVESTTTTDTNNNNNNNNNMTTSNPQPQPTPTTTTTPPTSHNQPQRILLRVKRKREDECLDALGTVLPHTSDTIVLES
jgi:hypothetical protein